MTWNSYPQDGTLNGVYAQRYGASGQALGSEFPVKSSSVAPTSDGGFLVVWVSGGENSAEVYGQRYGSSGQPLGGEFRVNTTTIATELFYQSEASVAALADGGFVVTWLSHFIDEIGWASVYGQRFNAAGAKVGAEFQVSVDLPVSGSVGVAGLSDGGFVTAWVDFEPVIAGQRYTAFGNPTGGPRLTINGDASSQQLTGLAGNDTLFGVSGQ